MITETELKPRVDDAGVRTGSEGGQSDTYSSSVTTERSYSAGASIAITLLLFIAVPLANYFWLLDEPVGVAVSEVSTLPPPLPPVQPPPPPDDAKEVEQPELQPDQPPLTLTQIDAMLTVGMGSAKGDFRTGWIGGFDAEKELEIFDVSELDKPPLPTQRIAPAYPYEARQQNLSGWVKVAFIVDELGVPRDARVESSSHRAFESAALDAIRLWRFTPGLKDGNPVRTRMLLPFVFNLGT